MGDVIAAKYEIISILGEGGMGIVYEAVHRRLDQRVAVKLLRPELADDPEYVRRFEREARAVGQLRSEHVVRIQDVDVTASGIPYMVMEMLDGHDLSKEYELRGPIPLLDLSDWMVQACSAIAEAHALGIIHRDLKPSNIFLSEQGDKSVIAKVLDFGVSKFNGAQFSTTTTTQKTIGTPQYMAPEQVRGVRDLDGRCDVWALGVMQYRLLTGRFPFEGSSNTALAVAIATEPAVGLDVLRPDLPGGFVAAVMKALEKDRRNRFGTMTELTEAIMPFGTGRHPLAPRLSASARAASRPSFKAPSRRASQGATKRSTGNEATVPESSAPYSRTSPQMRLGGDAPTRVEPRGSSGTPVNVTRTPVSRASRTATVGGIAIAAVAAAILPFLMLRSSREAPALGERRGEATYAAPPSPSPREPDLVDPRRTTEERVADPQPGVDPARAAQSVGAPSSLPSATTVLSWATPHGAPSPPSAKSAAAPSSTASAPSAGPTPLHL